MRIPGGADLGSRGFWNGGALRAHVNRWVVLRINHFGRLFGSLIAAFFELDETKRCGSILCTAIGRVCDTPIPRGNSSLGFRGRTVSYHLCHRSLEDFRPSAAKADELDAKLTVSSG